MTGKKVKRTELVKSKERLWFSDFATYAADLLRIQTKASTLVPFRRNPIQKVKADIKADIRANRRLMRLVILKARQFGISTDELMEMLWQTSTKPFRNSIVVTHEPDSTAYLFGVVKRAWANIPIPEWKPSKKNSNAKELIFEGIDSAIRVGTAGKDNLGSGTVIHRALLSELAKWPRHTVSSILTSLFQAIPKTMESELVIESTAQGVGGEFHSIYWGARYRYEVFMLSGKPTFRCEINQNSSPDNVYSAVFIPWFAHNEYELDPEPGFRRTEDEDKLADRHGLTDSQLAWRRHTIANECLGSVARFHQEYPSTALEAFLASGRPVFDPMELIELQKLTRKKPVAYYSLSAGVWIASTPMGDDANGLLQVWNETQAGASYVIPGDVSEGLEHGDWDSADVIDQRTGKQVAHWHGHTSPDKFGEILLAMAKRYNNGWIVPERNNHGLTTLTFLVNSGYEHICPELNPKPGEKARNHYGFVTGNSKTSGKAVVIDELAAFFRASPDAIQSRDTLDEMQTYKHNPDGTMGAEGGHYDDRVMSMAIGNFVRTRLPLSPGLAGGGGVVRNDPALSANSWT